MCVIYDCGSSIFNKPDKISKYRQNAVETLRFNVDENDIYKNMKPSKTLIYLRTKNNPNPIVNIFFTSMNSAKEYC